MSRILRPSMAVEPRVIPITRRWAIKAAGTPGRPGHRVPAPRPGRRWPERRGTGGLLLRRLVAVAGGFDDQIRHALGVFLLGDVAARESADGPAARFGRAPAAVGLRAFLDRLVLGHERDIG